MTNLIPIEALNHFLDGDYTEEQKKKVRRILNAQLNYEIRDLCLSIFARENKEKIYKKDGKRFFNVKNIAYPFKQSSPKILVDEYKDNLALNEIVFKYSMQKNTTILDTVVYYLCLIFENSEIADLWGYFFFCNKKYTEETGIEPHEVEYYEQLVKEYVEYINWKINK